MASASAGRPSAAPAAQGQPAGAMVGGLSRHDPSACVHPIRGITGSTRRLTPLPAGTDWQPVDFLFARESGCGHTTDHETDTDKCCLPRGQRRSLPGQTTRPVRT